MPGITGAEVRAVQLRRPGWGRRGYAPAEVEAFLMRATEALDAVAAGRTAAMTADEVRHVVFRKPKLGAGRGYDEDQVDDLLDVIEGSLRACGGGSGSGSVMLNGLPLEG
ncbi:MAG: DivIVA domain-containing protein [Actinomycetota bacterium]|nr:DivIVA domain-containing protein [Actinomycetota bacterium]